MNFHMIVQNSSLSYVEIWSELSKKIPGIYIEC